MALILNIETLRKYAAINFTNASSKMPDFAGCENKYLIPILGQTIYNDLQTKATANNTTDPLLILVRKALAPLTYYKELPIIHLQVGDKGLYTATSENVKSATRWEFNALRDYFAEEGCAALEILLQYLYDNKTALGWAVPDAYKLLFLTGNEFSKYFPLFQPYRTFEFLRTISRQVEDEFVIPNIGETVFIDLRDNYATTEDTRIKKILQLLKKAAAFHTIKLACDLLPTKFTGTGFTVQLAGYSSDAVNGSENNAPDANIIALKNSCINSADTYMQTLKEYLNATASTEFLPNYYNSYLYKNPNIEKPRSINESTKTFFL